MKNKGIRGLIAAAALGTSLLSTLAHADDVLFDSLHSAIFTGVSLVNNIGASFSTGNAAEYLTDLKLSLLGAAAGTVAVSIDTDCGNTPCGSLTLLGNLGIPANYSNQTYDLSGLSFALAANSRYWIELRSTQSSIFWDFTQDLSGTGVANEYLHYTGQPVQNAYLDRAHMMEVTASTSLPVPEPESFALMGAGLGLAGLLQRRRRTVPAA